MAIPLQHPLPVEPVGESESLQVTDWNMILEAHHHCDQSRLSRKVGGYSFVSILVAGGCLSHDMNSLPMLDVLLKILRAKCQCSFARSM